MIYWELVQDLAWSWLGMGVQLFIEGALLTIALFLWRCGGRKCGGWGSLRGDTLMAFGAAVCVVLAVVLLADMCAESAAVGFNR